MFIRYLTHESMINFLKKEYKYVKIQVLKIEKEHDMDTANIDIVFKNINGEIFKRRVLFTDFKCEMQDLASGKFLLNLNKQWQIWVFDELKLRENMGDKTISSINYERECQKQKDIHIKTKLKNIKRLRDRVSLNIGI